MKSKILFTFLFFASSVWCTHAQDTIAINSSVQYQTIKGWGTTGHWNFQYEGIPQYLLTQLMDVAANDMGLTDLRYESYEGNSSKSYAMCRTWEWQNDNGSPDTINWSAFDTVPIDYWVNNVVLPWKQKVTAAGDSFNFYFSPSWFVGGSVGTIPTYMLYSPGEYAEFIITNLLYLKNKYGLVPQYVTVCNEAGNGNAFTPQVVSTMIKTVGKRMQEAGLTPQIQFPECLNAQTTWNYIQALQSDTAMWSFVKCISWHLYGANNPYRANISAFANTMGIPTAQTETIGLGIDNLFDDLTLGNVSYWDFYWSEDYAPQNTNETWFTLSGIFWSTRQVFKHVRPGAVRIDAISNDSTMRTMAFIKNGAVTTIILNDKPLSITQPVTITGLPPGDYCISQDAGTYSELGISTVGGASNLTLTVPLNAVIAIYPHTANLPPFVTSWASVPTFLTLPANTVNMAATAVDPENNPLTYQWTVDSFPAGATVTLGTPTYSYTGAYGLTVAGNYVFSVIVSDGIASTTKTITVQVFAGNQPPEIILLQSLAPVMITLPVDSTILRGIALDVEGDSLTLLFSLVSQPGGASAQLVPGFIQTTQIGTYAKNLTIPGDYIFRLSVSDATHTTTRDITVTAYPLDNPPVIASVSASPNPVSLPADSSLLSSYTSDPDGDVITHWWTVKSTPAGANPAFSMQGERMTEVNNLTIPGTYIFTLTLIDNTLFTTMDDTVIVNAATSIENIPLDSKIILYPNPASDELNIQFTNTQDKISELMISDPLGQVVIEKNDIGDNIEKITVPLKSLSAGIYFVKAGDQVSRFVKE